ncbi:MAG: zinc-binding dehydrogenase [bacterium]|nr:MAG: oxidoreductase [bacterium]
MHAIVLREFGPPGVLRLERVADPEPAAGQLRIAVTAAGVHRIDAWVRAGIESPATLPLPALPWVPGREVAGVVDAVGPGVDPGWLGRRVVAHLGPAAGGYAERAVCAEDAALVIPEGVGDDVAVAMIGTGRTALGVLDVARVERGDVALVTGAAGGVGSLLVQHLHRVAGATVVAAVGGAAKVEHAGEDGADVVVDYSEPGWTRAVRDALEDGAVSLVLDGVGGRVGRDAFELLGAGGRFVFFGWASGTPTAFTTDDLYARGLTAAAAVGPALFRLAGGMRALQERALAAAAAGVLTPRIQRFPLADAAAAHSALEARTAVGKVVLVP